MKTCENCRYFREASALMGGQKGQGECLFHPPTAFMVATRNPAGDMIPGFVSARPTTHTTDYCSKFSAATW